MIVTNYYYCLNFLDVKIFSTKYSARHKRQYNEHVYGKTVWPNPKKGQRLHGQRERDADALLVDQYAVAWMMKSKEKLVADVVGHIPQEISRFVYFFSTSRWQRQCNS